jgi:hypothetical protein
VTGAPSIPVEEPHPARTNALAPAAKAKSLFTRAAAYRRDNPHLSHIHFRRIDPVKSDRSLRCGRPLPGHTIFTPESPSSLTRGLMVSATGLTVNQPAAAKRISRAARHSVPIV